MPELLRLPRSERFRFLCVSVNREAAAAHADIADKANFFHCYSTFFFGGGRGGVSAYFRNFLILLIYLLLFLLLLEFKFSDLSVAVSTAVRACPHQPHTPPFNYFLILLHTFE